MYFCRRERRVWQKREKIWKGKNIPNVKVKLEQEKDVNVGKSLCFFLIRFTFKEQEKFIFFCYRIFIGLYYTHTYIDTHTYLYY